MQHTQRSIVDEINRESRTDIFTIAVSYLLMFLYITLFLGHIRSFATLLVSSLPSVLLCFTVVYCGLLWFTVFYCGLLCFTVVYCSLLCFTVFYCGLLWFTKWFTVFYCVLLCFTVVYCGLLWFTGSERPVGKLVPPIILKQ